MDKPTRKIIDKGIKELKKIFDKDFNVVHSAISKNSKAYPVIQTGYEKELQNIREWIEQFDDLVPIGRSGMFKYNNQDHAMATGQLAARNYLGLGEFDVWQVNVDGEYHEEITKYKLSDKNKLKMIERFKNSPKRILFVRNFANLFYIAQDFLLYIVSYFFVNKKNRQKKITIITAADSSHFQTSKQLISSIQKHEKKYKYCFL